MKPQIDTFLKIFVLVALLTGMTSCFYSTKYVAEYQIKTNPDISETQKEIENIVVNLSEDYELMTDKKYNETDTLGYFGNPYHYFKYWTSKQDTVISLTLNYNGVFGKRKQPPYESMLNQLTDDLNDKFKVLDLEVLEKSNRKLKRKKK